MRLLYQISLFIFCYITIVLADEYARNEIDSLDPQSFPSINFITNSNSPISMYAINLDKSSTPSVPVTNDYVFDKRTQLPPGTELELNGYVIAVELLDLANFESLGNKSDRQSTIDIFNSRDPQKINDFFIKFAEKYRGAKTPEEYEQLKKAIAIRGTGDDPGSTNFFPTGMIEVSPLNANDRTRFFIKLEDINRIQLNPKKSKIKVLNSVTLLGFQNLATNINYGDLDDETIAVIDNSEKLLSSPCADGKCLNKVSADLGSFVDNIFSIINYDFYENFDDLDNLTETAILAQACLIREFDEVCEKSSNKLAINNLLSIQQMEGFLRKPDMAYPNSCGRFK